MTNLVTTMNDNEAMKVLAKGYTRRLTPDPSGGYTASILEFPGCFAEGSTADEALQNLESTALSWIAVSLANGRAVRDPVCFDGFSGKIALRIPRGLHQQVAELAELEECSVNQLLTTAIAQYVSKIDAVKGFERTVRQTLGIGLQAAESDHPQAVNAATVGQIAKRPRASKKPTKAA